MPEKEIAILIEKYKNGTLSEAEKAFLDAWYINYAREKNSSFNSELLDQNLDKIWATVEENVSDHGFNSTHVSAAKVSLWPRMVSAACVLLVLGIGFYFYKMQDGRKEKNEATASSAIKPGGNKAFLTLADGSRISLNDAANGKLLSKAGITITKTKNGQLIYTVADQQSANSGMEFNIIETPRGGQYQVNLPDGSMVWLNAESKLKYPVTFANKAQRRVELKGEAYFEVAKVNTGRGRMPFIVTSSGQEVTVLGTHFNVNAYGDDEYTKTTLLEGAVRVSRLVNPQSAKLIPGQQASLSPTALTLKNVDTEQAVAWKNGQFMFNNAPLLQVMKEVARWYDVEVVYKGDFSAVVIGGGVSKFTNIREVLDVLELAGDVKIKIEGRKVVVSPRTK